MATVFPEDENFDPVSNSPYERTPLSNPLKRIQRGLAHLRGGSRHEPIHAALGTPQFALCAAFNEKLKQEFERFPSSRASQVLKGVVHLKIDNTVPDGYLKPMNDAAREALQRFQVAALLDATDSGEPPLGEGELDHGTV